MNRIGTFVLVAVVGLGVGARGGVSRAQEGLSAQEGVTLNGTVEDQTGALIPGGKLTLLNMATAEAVKTVSDDAGKFSFSNVIPGQYTLKAVAEGFDAAVLTITVGTRPLKAIKVRMEINVSEEVTVSASQPESSDSNADAVSLASNVLGYLPTQGQDILAVLNNFLSPAAMGSSGPTIVVDGVETSDLTLGTNDIKTVVINKSPYSAEYLRPGLARIEIVTKSGTRKNYEGGVGLSWRISTLSARNAFAVEKPKLDNGLFDAYIIGPLMPFKRTTSFLLSGSRLIDDQSAVVNALTPSGPILENVPTFKRKSTFLGRIDIKPNTLNRIVLTYNFFDQPQRNRGVGGLKLAEQGTDANNRGHKFQTAIITTSTNLINSFRFSVQQRNRRVGSLAEQPTIKVKGAFTGGPSSAARLEEDQRLEFQDVAVHTRGAHTFTFGGGFRPKFVESRDATNFNGTFTFADLADYEAGQPILFKIVQGNPKVSFSQHEAYGFFQDEIKLSKHLNLMLGLRYDWQAQLSNHYDFAPRLALAFAPGKQKTVFRAGAGIFYDRLPESAIQRSLLIDGLHTRELVIENPSYPDPSKAGEERITLPSVWTIASNISAPYLLQANFSVQRRLGRSNQLTVDYQTLRGLHLYRTRNINAPSAISATVPNPNFDLINQVESSASLRSNALAVTLQGAFAKNFKGLAQYTLSRTTDDTHGALELPANNYDLRPEKGRSDLDKTHRLNFAGIYTYRKEWRISGVLSVATGMPFDITTGSDDNNDGVDNDRPPGVIRNIGRGPGFIQLDVRLTRTIQVPTVFGKELRPGKKNRNMDINLDVFNVFNRNNLTDVVGEMSSPLFGKPTASLQARAFQLSVRYRF